MKLGVWIEVIDDGMIIYGKLVLKGNIVNSYGDYCIGMMFVIVGCLVEGKIIIEDVEVVGVLYFIFFDEF